MAVPAYLLSTLVTGLLLLAVVAYLRMQGWRSVHLGPAPAPAARTGERSGGSALTTGFVLTVVGLLAAAVIAAGVPAGVATSAAAGAVLAVGFVALFAAFLVYGVYASARANGLGEAAAAGVSAWAFGLVLLVSVVAVLLVG